MDNEPKTLKQIADAEGISHQAVMEILERAYKKIRKILKEKGITQASDIL